MILSYEHAIFAVLCSKPAGTSGRLQSTVNNPSNQWLLPQQLTCPLENSG